MTMMIRTAASAVARRSLLTAQSRCAGAALATCGSSSWQQHASSSTGRPTTTFGHVVPFHASAKQQDDAAPVQAVVVKKDDESNSSSGGLWDPIYAIPLGIAFAVPAIHYEWYLFNEETQLAACFMMFTLMVYKNFGGMIHASLEEEGKLMLEEHNKLEDEMIHALENKLSEVRSQAQIVEDAETIKALKLQTYEKLNAVGKIKPQHDFKVQVERLLSMMEQEEALVQAKTKVALMEEATAAVMAEFATSMELQKSSLTMAIGQLKSSKGGTVDPVKDAYLKFFQKKSAAAATMDESVEIKQAREGIIAKMNSVAMNEGFFFRLGPDGKPVMNA